ncbi:MAG: outer membrane beta-barrel protein [bacterium]|nr:outer membrane beta-barrel protein [bacterium]
MKLTKLSTALLGCAAISAGAANAAAPTLKEVLGASEISVTGYADAAFTYMDTDSGTFSPNYFDNNSSNTFRFKQAGLTIASQPASGFGALVNLTGGDDANSIHSLNGGSTSNIDVTQAFVQYAGSGFTVIGGKFNTLAGAEVISPTGNTNISRSIAFLNALPFTHTGVRVSYAPVSTLTLYAGVNNGWDQADDQNKTKTTELGVSYAPVDMISGAVYAYLGGEGTSSPTQKLTLVDVIVTIKPIAPLAIILNYDMDKLKDGVAVGQDAKWTALNAYLNYQITDKLRTSLRLEQFDDKDGFKFGAPDNKIKGATLTVGYAPVPAFELRGEVRRDKADVAVFTKDGAAEDKQTYAAVEGLYKF